MIAIRYPTRDHALSTIALAAGIAALYVALYQIPHFGDFENHFYPAAQLDNPYDHPLLNPPWTLLILRPFLLLPVHAAGTLWTTLSVCLVVYSARALGAGRLGLFLLLFNPFTWFFVTLGQLDALVLLGLAVTWRPLDVLLLTIKPHVIGTAVLFRLREYRQRDWLLLAAVSLASLLIWWNWPLQMLSAWPGGIYRPLSLDIWPYGVPFGLALLWLAWKRENAVLGAISMYFLTPYVGPGSIVVYAALVFAAAPRLAQVALYLLLWGLALSWLI